jgi:hypothetical protein
MSEVKVALKIPTYPGGYWEVMGTDQFNYTSVMGSGPTMEMALIAASQRLQNMTGHPMDIPLGILS